MDSIDDWIGRSEVGEDHITAEVVRRMHATIEPAFALPLPGDALPALWHWLFFLPVSPLSERGDDGHPRKGGFLPPIELPRRMWAGSRLLWTAHIKVGQQLKRISEIKSIRRKSGSSGALVFVTVLHRYFANDEVILSEEHDIVYRGAPSADAPATPSLPAPEGEEFAREVSADEVLLFRYSALTFNSHRIHYDRSYVTGTERYPGLIVHGPLIATLLTDHLSRHRPGSTLKSFEFRAVSPIFDNQPFVLCVAVDASRGGYQLWAKSQSGALHMQAHATLDGEAP